MIPHRRASLLLACLLSSTLHASCTQETMTHAPVQEQHATDSLRKDAGENTKTQFDDEIIGELRQTMQTAVEEKTLSGIVVMIERDEFQGVAEIDGVRRQISVMYVPEAEVGDYVLVHAGLAIGQVDADEAAKTLELLREYSDAMVEL